MTTRQKVARILLGSVRGRSRAVLREGVDMQVFLIALGLVAVLVAVGVFGHHPDHRDEAPVRRPRA